MVTAKDVNVARSVLKVTVKGRKGDARFPLTGGWIQKVSRRLGYPLGEHKALAVVKELVADGTIVVAGSYRQRYSPSRPSGWRVALYRMGGRAASYASSVRGQRSCKQQKPQRPPWWKHPLFGTGEKTAPRTYSRRLRQWNEPPFDLRRPD